MGFNTTMHYFRANLRRSDHQSVIVVMTHKGLIHRRALNGRSASHTPGRKSATGAATAGLKPIGPIAPNLGPVPNSTDLGAS